MAGTRTHGSRTGRESAGVSTDLLHSVFMTSSSTPLFDTVLQQLDLDLAPWRGQGLAVRAPRDGTVYAELSSHTPLQAQALIDGAHAAFLQWRTTPAPVRGELVRRLGQKLRQLADANHIPYKVDIYPYYGSDGEAFWRAGGDVAVALIGPGVDASHNYERTHLEALTGTTRWLVAYLLS